VLHQRELEARDRRHEQTPDFGAWRAALVALAEALQRADGRPGGGDSTQTALALADCPSSLSATLIDFSIDASVLQRVGDSLRFTHQLLQESLAADVLLDAAKTGSRPASDFWPQSRWWQRSGWEVVAEIAAEACEGDVPAQLALIRWLALDHPGLAADVWLHIDRPALPPDLLSQTAAQWRPRLTDVVAEPAPAARAAIGRWLGLLDLDDRRGVGLGSDGLPDIDWVEFDDCLSFTYQGTKHPGLPPFALSRHLVTNRQFQAFVDSPDGYAAPRWWSDVHDQLKPSLRPATWPEANCPRENVNWFEAVAFCRWLTEHLHRSGRLPLSQVISLPTEHQWERAARGRRGLPFPNSGVYIIESINYEERNSIGAGTSLLRTCAVGLYPQSATQEGGLLDMLGNVSEWCSDTYSPKLESDGIRLSLAARVHRGGCWNSSPVRMSTLARDLHSPLGRHNGLGFRVCRTSPSESRASGR
jgi:hypothetical protein